MNPDDRALLMRKNDVDPADLDPGIRDTVLLLRSHGFVTTDSGDGVTKPADQRVFDVPHVAVDVAGLDMIVEADRLADDLDAVAAGQWLVQATYTPHDGSAIILATKTPRDSY